LACQPSVAAEQGRIQQKRGEVGPKRKTIPPIPYFCESRKKIDRFFRLPRGSRNNLVFRGQRPTVFCPSKPPSPPSSSTEKAEPPKSSQWPAQCPIQGSEGSVTRNPLFKKLLFTKLLPKKKTRPGKQRERGRLLRSPANAWKKKETKKKIGPFNPFIIPPGNLGFVNLLRVMKGNSKIFPAPAPKGNLAKRRQA